MVTIEQLRAKIQEIDASIIAKVAEREVIAKQIGEIKSKQGKEIVDLLQEKKLFDFYQQLAIKYQLQPEFIEQLFKLIIDHSRSIQKI